MDFRITVKQHYGGEYTAQAFSGESSSPFESSGGKRPPRTAKAAILSLLKKISETTK